MAFLTDLVSSFILGLLTPLTAVCVLPLYPGFIAYLSSQLQGQEKNKKLPIIFGLLISTGVILFMLLLGLIFTTLLQESLTKVIGVVSPIAFVILLIISLLLIFNIDLSRIVPKAHAPITNNPKKTAFLYGFFFGAIVIPCNPAFIAAFFARALLQVNPIANIISFISFGMGIAAPLLAFSIISSTYSQIIISFLTKHKRKINLLAGLIMLGISLYYLFLVFKIQNLLG